MSLARRILEKVNEVELKPTRDVTPPEPRPINPTIAEEQLQSYGWKPSSIGSKPDFGIQWWSKGKYGARVAWDSADPDSPVRIKFFDQSDSVEYLIEPTAKDLAQVLKQAEAGTL